MCNRKQEIEEKVFEMNGKLFKKTFKSVLSICCDCHVVWVYVSNKEMKNETF